MNRFSLAQMTKMKHLSDLIMPPYKKIAPHKLITEVGLYEAVLIDTADIKVVEPSNDDALPYLMVSPDVAALHCFINIEDSIMLPCPDCNQNQPFNLKMFINPRKVTLDTSKSSKTPAIIPIPRKYESTKGSETCHNIFDQPEIPSYRIGNNILSAFDRTQILDTDYEEYLHRCALACVEGLARQVDEIRRDFFCTFSSVHRGFVDFIIYEAVDRFTKPEILQRYEERKVSDPNTEMTKDEREAAEYYKKLQTCLIMEKVGQYPSMADLQMFEIEKYRTVLNKVNKSAFRDFRTALGLYASGVGCGSFVYLRRIFEGLVVEAEKTASIKDNWNAEEYRKLDFNRKIVTCKRVAATI